MSRIDAILHIADLPALTAAIAASDPARVTDAEGRPADDPNFDPATGRITGFVVTPARHASPAALVYVRATDAEADTWRAAAGVTVLAEAPYAGAPRWQDLMIAIDGRHPITGQFAAAPADVSADAGAKALYDGVYDRTPFDVSDGAGGTVTVTPPACFGTIS